MSPDISIIVPMYNVEKFLPRCIESLINQTFINIEIILVDDESPDNSGLMADEYAKNDSRITVIHQKNKWLGGARNSGIRQARGEYILFVDSDDYISLDACEKLIHIMKSGQPDVIMFDSYSVDRDGTVLSSVSHNIAANIILEKEQIKDLLHPIVISSHEINSACMKMYKTSILKNNNLYFDEKIRYAEDYEYVLRLLQKINSFLYLKLPLYYYVENSNSIMHVCDPNIVQKFVTLYQYREKFLSDTDANTPENQIRSSELLISMIVKSLRRYLGDIIPEKRREQLTLIEKMIEVPEVQHSIRMIKIRNLKLGCVGKVVALGIKYKLKPVVFMCYSLFRDRL